VVDQETVWCIASSWYRKYYGHREIKISANCIMFAYHCHRSALLFDLFNVYCIKKLSVLKREIGKRKKHKTRVAEVHFSNFIGALFTCCSITLCISWNFYIRVYLCVHWVWFTAFTWTWNKSIAWEKEVTSDVREETK
jgi:hypothetical protein